VVLVGTGEVTRCLAVHGAGRVRAAVLAAPLRPFLLNMNNGPEGVGRSVFDAPLAGTGTLRSITAAAIRPPRARRVLGRSPRSLSTVRLVAARCAAVMA